jgi:hypothetical protein
VRTVGIETRGRYSPDVAQRVARSAHARLRVCYARARRSVPLLQGKLTVAIELSRDGTVTHALARPLDLPDYSVRPCVEQAFRGLSFPPTDGRYTQIVYTLAFDPG